MEENFNPVARTRANYYTPGSPVQFVCVELLKGELSGENAVCLTFKNISKVTLTALEIHFKCKGVDGIILCEDAFEYREIEVKPGESFGMDDAVFVTQKAITSVDVVLKNVYSGKKVVHLDAIKRVRLPAPRRLSPELEKALESRMNRSGLKYMPQVFENGWYCSCGSFHPKEGGKMAGRMPPEPVPGWTHGKHCSAHQPPRLYDPHALYVGGLGRCCHSGALRSL